MTWQDLIDRIFYFKKVALLTVIKRNFTFNFLFTLDRCEKKKL